MVRKLSFFGIFFMANLPFSDIPHR